MANRNPNYKEDAKKGGRPKGSKDKLSRDLKVRVMQVWDDLKAEGKDLGDVAKDKPDWFYANFVKPMLPKDVIVQGDSDNPILTKVSVEFVKPKS